MSKLLIALFFLLNILNVADLFSTFLGITKLGYSFEANEVIVFMVKNYGWIGCGLIKVLGILFGTLLVLCVTHKMNNWGIRIYEKIIIIVFYFLCVGYIIILFINFIVLSQI